MIELIIPSVLLVLTFIYCLASFGNEGFNAEIKLHFTVYGLAPTMVLIFQMAINNIKLQGDDNGEY